MNIIWYPATSLDGYIATIDGNSDWVTPEDEDLFNKEVEKAGCVIVGRTTYEQYKGTIYPIANTKTYIVTSDPTKYESNEKVIFVAPNASKICERIERDGFTTVVLSGGGETSGLFAKAHKINEAIISIYPKFIGEGIKMLGSFSGLLNMELVSTKNLSGGVIQNRYKIK